MQELDRKLTEYRKTDVYPFHMPGHKRQAIECENPYEIDITEISGFDNLHQAEGILKEAQERASELYGAKKSYYLINGSTCGILAAICACTRKQDKILMARNCHKAVYHAVFLNELQVEYLYPEVNAYGIQEQITPEQVEKAFYKNQDVSALVLTSPTYEGVVSDIEKIAEIAHRHHVPLIVDEAHGAHFGLSPEVPEEAGKKGADIVVMSLHKTLPSFTQTALLHLFSERISSERVEKYLGIFETSSPSYLLMAGMERCIRMMREKKDILFSEYKEKLDRFYHATEELQVLHVLKRRDFNGQCYDWDFSKIMIYSHDKAYTGAMLQKELLENYHLEMEMVSAEYVLAMTSVMDTEAGFHRLEMALREIDTRLLEKKKRKAQTMQEKEESLGQRHLVSSMYQPLKREMQIAQAEQLNAKEVSFSDAVGQISAEYVYLYPPGIPVVVPGEVLEEELLRKIERCMELGLFVQGAKNIHKKRIKIVYF